MNQLVEVGVIGDYDPNNRFHRATDEALVSAAEALSVSVDICWIPTESLKNGSIGKTLSSFDSLWGAPGSPYKSMEGALQGIRFAREKGWPFLGT
jgi:CTP synthase (UTP-ammonia lyase)